MGGLRTRVVWWMLGCIALLGGILAAVEIASYEQRGAVRPEYRGSSAVPPGPPNSWYYWATPWWAYVGAVAVSLLGLTIAVAIYFVFARSTRERRVISP